MRHDSMLRRLTPDSSDTSPVTLHWHDQEITAQTGDTVASALLLAGIRSTRNSSASQSPRLPFCMMGSCFECLVDIDGQIVQSCMVMAEDGMKIKKPESAQ